MHSSSMFGGAGAGFLSLLVCGIHVVVLSVRKSVLVPYVSEDYILGLQICLGFLMLVSVVAILGVIKNLCWLLIPYILFFGLFVIGYTSLLFYIAVYGSFYFMSVGPVVMFGVEVIMDIATMFCLYAVVKDFWNTAGTSRRHSTIRDEEGRPLFDDIDRQHSLKPTIVSKLLHEYDHGQK